MLSKIKEFFKQNEADIILIIGIVLIALISFGAGWLMGNKKTLNNDSVSGIINNDKVSVEEMAPENKETIQPTTNQSENIVSSQKTTSVNNQQTNTSSQNSQCKYVGSKNSDVYHLPECSGAQRIKEENKRCFSSKEEAEKSGYRPAANCPGI